MERGSGGRGLSVVVVPVGHQASDDYGEADHTQEKHTTDALIWVVFCVHRDWFFFPRVWEKNYYEVTILLTMLSNISWSLAFLLTDMRVGTVSRNGLVPSRSYSTTNLMSLPHGMKPI